MSSIILTVSKCWFDLLIEHFANHEWVGGAGGPMFSSLAVKHGQTPNLFLKSPMFQVVIPTMNETDIY